VQAAEARDITAPVVCLGEALVDLICPDPVDDAADAANFETHFGGALANVAVAIRRAGAPAALAGGCGDDDWGRFLRDRLLSEGVELGFHSSLPGLPTPYAFATLDAALEPTFRIQAEGIVEGIAALSGRERELAGIAAAVVVGSNTLPDESSHAITTSVCEVARERGVPVLFDPNLRPGRWSDLERARSLCLELIGITTLLKCNLREARWLLGLDDAAGASDAAEGLLELGPRLVVVTAGTADVIARGACSAQVRPPEVEMVSPLGAGDVFMGTLAGGLHLAGWRLEQAGVVMQQAAEAAAEACTRLGVFY
jgi:sugar/nucleoside kinase (ribokinase family)